MSALRAMSRANLGIVLVIVGALTAILLVGIPLLIAGFFLWRSGRRELAAASTRELGPMAGPPAEPSSYPSPSRSDLPTRGLHPSTAGSTSTAQPYSLAPNSAGTVLSSNPGTRTYDVSKVPMTSRRRMLRVLHWVVLAFLIPIVAVLGLGVYVNVTTPYPGSANLLPGFVFLVGLFGLFFYVTTEGARSVTVDSEGVTFTRSARMVRRYYWYRPDKPLIISTFPRRGASPGTDDEHQARVGTVPQTVWLAQDLFDLILSEAHRHGVTVDSGNWATRSVIPGVRTARIFWGTRESLAGARESAAIPTVEGTAGSGRTTVALTVRPLPLDVAREGALAYVPPGRRGRTAARILDPPPASALEPVTAGGRYRALSLNSGKALREDQPFTQRFSVSGAPAATVLALLGSVAEGQGFKVVFTPPATSKRGGTGRETVQIWAAERALLADRTETHRRDRNRWMGIGVGAPIAGVGWYEVFTAAPHTLALQLGIVTAIGGSLAATISALTFTNADYWSDVILARLEGNGEAPAPEKGLLTTRAEYTLSVITGRALSQDWEGKTASGRQILALARGGPDLENVRAAIAQHLARSSGDDASPLRSATSPTWTAEN